MPKLIAILETILDVRKVEAAKDRLLIGEIRTLSQQFRQIIFFWHGTAFGIQKVPNWGA